MVNANTIRYNLFWLFAGSTASAAFAALYYGYLVAHGRSPWEEMTPSA